jgi:threonyl-tRNA synthetase
MLDSHDHRELGRSMDLFHFQEEAPGAVFWHPSGFHLFHSLKSAIRQWTRNDGYQEVKTPQIYSQSFWERSGHWDKNSHKFLEIPGEKQSFAVKPVNCPAHIELVKRMNLDHGTLPIKLSEFGVSHEADPGGPPDGLFRLIQFTVDDGHVFCREDQVDEQVAIFARSLRTFYASMGITEVRAALALRPPGRLGDDAMWDRAEALLGEAVRKAGLVVDIEEGKGAFYGPKLDFTLMDHRKRSWMCGTIHLDLALPQRFGLEYQDLDTRTKPVVILHRAMVGSLERFLGILLEDRGPGSPPWLNFDCGRQTGQP